MVCHHGSTSSVFRSPPPLAAVARRGILMGRLPPTLAGRQADLFADVAANDDAAPVFLPQPSVRRPSVTDATRFPSDEEMAERLVATSRYRVLRQLLPRPVSPSPSPWQNGLKLGVILDTETTGLDHATHEVIELGMVAFTSTMVGSATSWACSRPCASPAIPSRRRSPGSRASTQTWFGVTSLTSTPSSASSSRLSNGLQN